MRLPVRDKRSERIEAIDRWVDEFRGACGDDELAWTCLPHLLILLRSRADGSHEPSPFRTRQANDLWNRVRTDATRPTTLVDDHLFFAFSANQRLAQAPIAERLGPERAAPTELAVSDRREGELMGRAVQLIESLIAIAREHSLELPVRRRLYVLFFRAVRDLTCWEALLESVRPRSVTIGSTHSAASRSLALACLRAAVPCVYVPHAPVLTEARLADLPVDRAALRGPAEVSYYVERGADGSRIAAIGNPGVDAAEPELERADDASPVFALPTDDDWALEQLAAVVEAALGDGVIASPHPRADRDALRELLPASWELWEGRTFELLRQEPPALLQASSGVGLEGLQLGVPTIELAFPGERPNYPYLSAPEVISVSTSGELRQAVEAASRLDSAARERIRDRACAWVCAAGAEAAEAGAELIRRAAAEGVAAEPVWDAWRAGASAYAERSVNRGVAGGASSVA